MSNYTIVITESLRREVIVDADNYVDALNKAEDMWKDSKIILSADDWDGVEFREMSTGNGWTI